MKAIFLCQLCMHSSIEWYENLAVNVKALLPQHSSKLAETIKMAIFFLAIKQNLLQCKMENSLGQRRVGLEMKGGACGSTYVGCSF